MNLSRRLWPCRPLCLCGATLTAWGAVPSLPPMSGDAAGVFEREGIPPITWKAQVSHGKNGLVSLSAEASAKGFLLQASAKLNLATLSGDWNLTRLSVDPAVWLPVGTEQIDPAALAKTQAATPAAIKKSQDLIQKIKEALRETTITGLLEITGQGVLKEGRPDGAVSLRWINGSLSHESSGVKIAGGTAILQCDRLTPFKSISKQVLSFEKVEAEGVEIGPGLFVFEVPDSSMLHIQTLQTKLFGGEFKAFPLSIPLDKPLVDMRARFDAVQLEPLLPVLNKAGLAEAKGRLDGGFRLIWSKERDLHSAVFELDPPDPGMSPVVRLSPHPGALTSSMPKDFDLLPVFKSLFRQPNPVYKPLSDIEMGVNSLRLDSLRLLLEPSQTEGHHNLRIRFSARTVDPSIIPKISLELKVAGPLREILSMGMDSKLGGE